MLCSTCTFKGSVVMAVRGEVITVIIITITSGAPPEGRLFGTGTTGTHAVKCFVKTCCGTVLPMVHCSYITPARSKMLR
jgi:hypothetical protein